MGNVVTEDTRFHDPSVLSVDMLERFNARLKMTAWNATNHLNRGIQTRR